MESEETDETENREQETRHDEVSEGDDKEITTPHPTPSPTESITEDPSTSTSQPYRIPTRVCESCGRYIENDNDPPWFTEKFNDICSFCQKYFKEREIKRWIDEDVQRMKTFIVINSPVKSPEPARIRLPIGSARRPRRHQDPRQSSPLLLRNINSPRVSRMSNFRVIRRKKISNLRHFFFFQSPVKKLYSTTQNSNDVSLNSASQTVPESSENREEERRDSEVDDEEDDEEEEEVQDLADLYDFSVFPPDDVNSRLPEPMDTQNFSQSVSSPILQTVRNGLLLPNNTERSPGSSNPTVHLANQQSSITTPRTAEVSEFRINGHQIANNGHSTSTLPASSETMEPKTEEIEMKEQNNEEEVAHNLQLLAYYDDVQAMSESPSPPSHLPNGVTHSSENGTIDSQIPVSLSPTFQKIPNNILPPSHTGIPVRSSSLLVQHPVLVDERGLQMRSNEFYNPGASTSTTTSRFEDVMAEDLTASTYQTAQGSFNNLLRALDEMELFQSNEQSSITRSNVRELLNLRASNSTRRSVPEPSTNGVVTSPESPVICEHTRQRLHINAWPPCYLEPYPHKPCRQCREFHRKYKKHLIKLGPPRRRTVPPRPQESTRTPPNSRSNGAGPSGPPGSPPPRYARTVKRRIPKKTIPTPRWTPPDDIETDRNRRSMAPGPSEPGRQEVNGDESSRGPVKPPRMRHVTYPISNGIPRTPSRVVQQEIDQFLRSTRTSGPSRSVPGPSRLLNSSHQRILQNADRERRAVAPLPPIMNSIPSSISIALSPIRNFPCYRRQPRPQRLLFPQEAPQNGSAPGSSEPGPSRLVNPPQRVFQQEAAQSHRSMAPESTSRQSNGYSSRITRGLQFYTHYDDEPTVPQRTTVTRRRRGPPTDDRNGPEAKRQRIENPEDKDK